MLFFFIIVPLPVSDGYFCPIRSRKAADTTAARFPRDITANAGAYHDSGALPVISPHILLMGMHPAPFPPPIMGRATLTKPRRGSSPRIRAAAAVNRNDTAIDPRIAGIKPAKAFKSNFRSIDRMAPVISTRIYRSRKPTVLLKLFSVSTTESGRM